MSKTMLRIVAIVMIVLIIVFSGCIMSDEAPAEVEPIPAAALTETPVRSTEIRVKTPAEIPVETPIATPAETPTATLQELIDEALIELHTGNILFNPPKEMEVDDTELVEVRITQNITENLTEGLEGCGDPLINETKVSTSMIVRLTGKNFKIAPQNGAEQLIESDKYTEWRFYVTPSKSGIQTLHLTYYIIISIPGYDDKKKQYEVGDWEINVKVTPYGFLKSNWQFIVGTLLGIVSLIIAVIAIRKKS
ncbi:MAG: hypothetical protein C5S49_08060 [Candidatus Methanogaster sp.]|nr:MAG: hypothetical protein C5S49_08060 [ANME-2 cluster archaeon]